MQFFVFRHSINFALFLKLFYLSLLNWGEITGLSVLFGKIRYKGFKIVDLLYLLIYYCVFLADYFLLIIIPVFQFQEPHFIIIIVKWNVSADYFSVYLFKKVDVKEVLWQRTKLLFGINHYLHRFERLLAQIRFKVNFALQNISLNLFLQSSQILGLGLGSKWWNAVKELIH